MKRLFQIFYIVLFFSGGAFAVPTSFNYQGRILKPNGEPLQYNNVSFLFQVVSPNGACVIFQEQASGINMVNSGGVFDLSIGNNSLQYLPATASNFLDVFTNSGSFECASCTASGAGYSCSGSGTDYIPSIGDIRKLRVSFHDGTGWKTISPDNEIRSVPFAGRALAAEKIGTLGESDLLSKALAPTCVTANSFLQWNGTDFDCVAVSGSGLGTVTEVTSANTYLSVTNGTSTPQLTINVGTTAGTLAAGDDSRFTDARVPTGTAGGDLSNSYPNPTVSKLQGRAVDSVLPLDGQALLWDNGGSTWKPEYIRAQDIRTSWGGTQLIPLMSCDSDQAMTWSVITDRFSCQDIAGLDAGDITTGVLNTARLGTGTADNTTYLRGDGTWNTVTADPNTILNGGNTFGAGATLGTNDSFNLNFETAGTTKATLDTNGFLGLNTTTPQSFIDVAVLSGDTTSLPYITVSAHAGTYAEPSLVLLPERTTANLKYGDAGTRGWRVTSGSGNGGAGGMEEDFKICNRNGSAGENCRLQMDFDTGNTVIGGTNAGVHFGSRFNVIGNATIGGTWAAWGGTTAAPANSLIVEGLIGAGVQVPATPLDVNGAVSFRGVTSPALSPASQGRIYFDSGTNTFRASANGGAYQDLTFGGIMNGGNSYAAEMSIGTNDSNNFSIKTNNTSQLTMDTSGNITLSNNGNKTISVAGVSTGEGRDLTIQSGNGAGGGDGGGGLNLWAGDATWGELGARITMLPSIFNGGDITMKAGTSDNNGDAGDVIIEGGNNRQNQSGGEVYIRGGQAMGALNRDGGHVYISGGIPGGSNPYGNVYLGHDGTSARGNVGVGTTMLNGKLSVATSTDQDAIKINMGTSFGRFLDMTGARGLNLTSRMENTVSGGTVGWEYRVGSADFATRMTSLGANSGRFDFVGEENFGSPIMSLITSSTNVGIGTNNPQTKLQVEGVISPATNNTYSLGNSSYRFTEVYATNGVINTSDRREKKEIKDSNLGLEFIQKLRPVSYQWNTGVDSDIHYGLIAQEAEQAVQEIRGDRKPTSIVTRDPQSDRYGVRYSELISPLIKAVQELSQQTSQLLQKVQALVVQKAEQKDVTDLKFEIQKLREENNLKSQELQSIKSYLCQKDPQAPLCQTR